MSFRHDEPGRAGVLLVNLGTPDAPTASAVRRYLGQFLADRRVVDFNPLLWRLVLHGIILRIRPPRVSRAYASVWTDEGSPLLVLSRRLAERLDTALGESVDVALAMTYGNPSIPATLQALQARNVRRLLVLPLYPQYSGTTTAATFDGVAAALARRDWLPELRFVNDYHDEPAWIDALAATVREAWAEHGRPDRLLMSFHGIPVRYHLRGDPYPCQCRKTARLLAEALELSADEWLIAFQSRFGREPWLEPYTDQTLRRLAAEGTRRVQVICPGFAVDCLETLEEIAMMNRELFLEAGGEELVYIPALNDRDDHVGALARIVARHTAGWGDHAAGHDPRAAREQSAASAARARRAGAPR